MFESYLTPTRDNGDVVPNKEQHLTSVPYRHP